MVTLRDVCFDAKDANLVADFWADILGWAKHETPTGSPIMVTDGDVNTPRLWFNPVPDPTEGKNRVHVDVDLDDGGIEALVQKGARIVREPTPDTPWWVVVDPEDNEFCAFPPER
jgi:hypothetical protein